MKTTKTDKSKSAKRSVKPAEKAPLPRMSAPARPGRRAEAPASAKLAAAPNGQLSSELIAVRAYIIWEQQGRPQGSDVANWLLAESQLKEELQQAFTA